MEMGGEIIIAANRIKVASIISLYEMPLWISLEENM
jgi:hypothetical protein